jgi:hypothetical protein
MHDVGVELTKEARQAHHEPRVQTVSPVKRVNRPTQRFQFV